MFFDKKIIEAVFKRRPNRFQAYVEINGVEYFVHVPNTGRCKEILIPGCKVLLRKEDNPSRKTKFDLIAAYKGKKLINIDSCIPNKVVYEALVNGKIQSLQMYKFVEKEKTFGDSRFDFRLRDENNNEYYLEVKGVTLEHDGKVSFPDAPTERGRKHLNGLVEVKRTGRGAGVLFLVQMDNVSIFTPNDITDKAFGDALRRAASLGVDVFAYNCRVGTDHITLNEKIDIDLDINL